jgi:AGZA family xanthine/uracil permease-like MFS transporter
MVDGGIRSFFEFDEYDTDYRTEVIAGVTTFLAMAYVILVNPAILAQAIVGIGEDGEPNAETTIDGEVYTFNEVFDMLAVVTILAAVVAILVMALYANRPFGLAPGMGLNAFFTYTVVIALGVPWQTALAAVFVEGVVFIILTAAGVRRYLIELFPEPVKRGVGAGIGAFLLFLGLQEMEVVVSDPETLVTLGDIASSPPTLLALAGLGFTLVLYARGVRGSIVIGIVLTALTGWIVTLADVVEPGTVTDERLATTVEQNGAGGLVDVVTGVQYDFTPLAGAFLDGFQDVDPVVFVMVVFTFFFVDFFDTAGTLIGVSQIGDFLDEDGNLPEMERPLMADAVGTTVGAMLGTSTVTTYVESSAGIEEGGRTGLTALVVAALFVLSLLIVPLLAAIPTHASYIALVVVGVIMLQGVTEIDWNDRVWQISGGLTILVMPLTASIADGIAAGIIAYPLIKTAVGEVDDVHPVQWVLAALFVCYYYVTTSGVLTDVAASGLVAPLY